MRWRLDNDEGFSLAELVVVLGLMGVILAVAWASYSVISNGARMAEGEAMTAREIAVPLLECERLLIQQHNILDGTIEGRLVNPSPWLVAFNTDVDHDSHIESTIMEVTTDGRLLITTAEISEHDYETVVWSTANRNRATSTPFLTYYDGSGEVIGYDAVKTDARSVMITIATEYDGRAYSDSRTVSFRNR